MVDGCWWILFFNFLVIDAVAVLALVPRAGDARACPAVEEAVGAMPKVGLHLQQLVLPLHDVAYLGVGITVSAHTMRSI